MSYEVIYDKIHEAAPVPKVMAALNDDPIAAGIMTDQCPDALIASRLFNVATAGMDNLRIEPLSPLIEKPIAVDEPEQWLGRFTIRLLDDSLLRPKHRGYQYESSYVEKLGTCPNVEERFAEAVGYFGYDTEEPSLLFVDSAGNSVMLKKQSGESSTLCLKTISINNVKIPAGTIINLIEEKDAPRIQNSNFDIMRSEQSSIKSIAPLRFSAFSFRPEDRHEVMSAISGFELASEDDDVLEHLTLTDIINNLPNQHTLRQEYKKLE